MVKPLSIALIRGRYVQDGGAERFVARAMDALKSRDVKLTLITRAWRGGEGFDVIVCNPFYVGRVWRDWSFAQAACRTVERGTFDLVQSHERIACCDIYRAGDGVHREWLKQRARAQGALARLATKLNPYHYYVQAAEKRLFESPRLKAVICNSRMVKEEIKHYFGVADEKLHVIYSGVDADKFHPRLKQFRSEIRARHEIPESAMLLLFVGSGFERKGVPAILEAMTGLPESTKLLVVGRDKKINGFRRDAGRFDLARRVVFAGPQQDVKPYYGAADVLVLPTLYDPFPNVALEAMASGLPVMTSFKSGAAELIETGRSGFVCDALDVPTLTALLRALTPERANAMGTAARALAESFSLDRMSQNMLALYAGLFKQGA